MWFDLTKFWDPSGIESVGLQPTDGNCQYYDLQGRPVGDDVRGLVLRRSVNADGTVSVKKFIRK